MSLKVRTLAGLVLALCFAGACVPSEPGARFGLLRTDNLVYLLPRLCPGEQIVELHVEAGPNLETEFSAVPRNAVEDGSDPIRLFRSADSVLTPDLAPAWSVTQSTERLPATVSVVLTTSQVTEGIKLDVTTLRDRSVYVSEGEYLSREDFALQKPAC